MAVMAKKIPDEKASEKKKYPSRGKVRYIAIPVELYDWLKEFAAAHSTPFDKRSVSWAARQVIYLAKMKKPPADD